MTTIRAGLYGLIVADALGVPAESRTREDLRRNPITGMVGGGLHQQPAGYWSDDSSMTLCLADSIGKVGYYHTHDIMARFDDWCRNGAYTPGGKKFDIGNTCAWAIDRYRKGCTPALCGSNKVRENGNGSLMRILPMAFVLYKKYGIHITKSKRAMEDIHKISGLTHRHPLAQSACGIYLAIAVRILDGYELKAAIREGIYEALQWYGSHGKFQIVLDYWEKISDPDDLATLPNEIIYSGGYVVETMETVLWALMNTDNYRDCVLTCVNMGYDADSTAAIAGGLAGLYYGYNSIPTEWIDALANKELIDACINGLEEYINYNGKKYYAVGKCGDSLDFFFKSGTLFITGIGEMCDEVKLPWQKWPDEVQKVMIGLGCEGISPCAFEECTNLISISIPDSVTWIGAHAFRNCSSLISISIPNGVQMIDWHTFDGCTSLTSITLPNSVTLIDNEAFKGCSSLININIPDTVTEIGFCAFANCSGLMSITIPDSVLKIGSGAFAGCSGLTSITIPDSVTEIGSDAFAGCSGLTSITIPNGIMVIRSWTFACCTKLPNVIIPKGVSQIHFGAFAGCSSLTSITIPDSVTWIYQGAFDKVPHIIYHGPDQSDNNWGALSRN